MPDYLGDDQRRVKSDAGDSDKIQSEPNTPEISSKAAFSISFLFNAHPPGLDEGDIQLLKAYVSWKKTCFLRKAIGSFFFWYLSLLHLFVFYQACDLHLKSYSSLLF